MLPMPVPIRTLVLCSMLTTTNLRLPGASLDWQALPALPDKEGFAGSFAGVSRGALLVAGGANFPEKRPWEGGTKVWYDRVFALEPGGAAWRDAGRLPCANGYGVAATVDEGFARDVLAYDPVSDQWSRAGEVPFSLVTTSATIWQGRHVVPGGEARPGVRSTAVWAAGTK